MMKRYNHDELGMKASEEEEYLIECKSIHGDDDIGGPPQELSKMHTYLRYCIILLLLLLEALYSQQQHHNY